ncbi:MAG TPA: adenylate kinase [Anaerolineales bacterium]|nr:adenylate kinase [Anaerolineales bacterium]
MATYIVLLGPPGVGKGTQAKIIAQQTGLIHVSSGDLFRENIKNQTELGRLAKSFMDKGDLVPDDVTVAMIKDRLTRPDCKTGAILDGFPRTPVQAEELHEMLADLKSDIDLVPFVHADPQVLAERICGRLTCRAMGHIYHEKFNPPRVPGRCDIDGSELYQREDDKTETVANRIKVYLNQTAPLIDYYRRQNKLVEIDGTQPIEKVTDALMSVMKKAVK